MCCKNYNISLPVKIKQEAEKKAKNDFKSFSGYLKDLIIKDLSDKEKI